MKTAHQHLLELLDKQIPEMAYKGGDFIEWQRSAREKLIELLGMDKIEKVDPELEIEYEEKLEGMTEIRFTFASEEGYRVPCHMLLPDGVENPPVMICLQGHSTGMHISLARPKFPGDEEVISGGDRDFGIRAVKEGFAAVALEQRNFGESRGGSDGPRCATAALAALMLGRTTIGARVWDVERLIDIIETEFKDRVDIENISCMGNSGGGTATVYIAALDDRIKLAMPSCSMCTFRDSIGALEHCACNFIPEIANYFDMNDLFAMAAPKYFIQVSGIEDNIFPIEFAEKVFEKGKTVYEGLGVGDRCVLVKGNGGHRFFADDSWPYVHKYLGK